MKTVQRRVSDIVHIGPL